jgi:LmbE family N-acetylglucosaminyl deacetylase
MDDYYHPQLIGMELMKDNKVNGKSHYSGKRILAVLAHPDDESFGMGGTLAYYAANGANVYYVCATKGEAGEVPPEYMNGYGSIAELRETELRCAAEWLGLAGVYFLGYRDSGMMGSRDNGHNNALAAQPVDEVAAKVTHYIRKLRPQVVLTFDPVGGYHHPDHIAIQKATVRAFHAAGDEDQFPGDYPPYQPEKLYFHIFPRNLIRVIVRILRLFGKDPTRFGRNNDIDLAKLAGDEDYPVNARIDYRSVVERKIKADACHASQLDMGGQSNFIWKAFRKLSASSKDTFMRAHPPTPTRFEVRDLFDE